MENKVLHHYGEEFNLASAEQMVPYILELTKPESVVDVGCGIGTWLSVYKHSGIPDIVGIENEHIKYVDTYIDLEHYQFANLEEIITEPPSRTHDLVHCLEVAEHLHPESAPGFVNYLASLSDKIVFSAAIPGQTGENHFNEQYPQYWADLFRRKGYIYLDPFRKKFWNNPHVDWWYRQNMFLVVQENIADQIDADRWDGQFYVAAELLDMYTRHFDTVNSYSLSGKYY
jgi:hypothetical protein